ncbi:MAG: ankyrin repeat domain-containing protein [Limisphaerales bacterium]|jgi:ankyrin repeat protein
MRFIAAILVFLWGVNNVVLAAEIHTAAENGDLETVKKLVGQDAKLIDAPDREGKTPLHYAAAKGHLAVVEWLVKNGANVNARNSSGITPLYLAKGFGKKDVAEFLEKYGGSAEIVKPRMPTKTVAGSQTPQPGPTPQIKSALVPAIEAVKANSLEQLQLIIKTDPESINGKDQLQWTPLHWAADYGYLKIAEFLIENGANVNAKTDNGWTPLHQAVIKAHTNIARLLISKKADVNAQTSAKVTPLMLACGIAYNYEIAKMLLDAGADVNLQDQFGNTALSFAASVPDETKVCEMLIKAGAQVNTRDAVTGFTPLHHAALRNNDGLIQLLIKAGAEINATTAENDTPLLIARFENALKAEKVLLQYGAKEPQRRQLTPIEQSLVNFYKKVYDTLAKGDPNEIRKQILANRPSKADIERVFIKNADVAYELVQKTSRDEDVAWASVAKSPELKTQLVEVLRGDARAGEYYILETDVMSAAARIAKERGLVAKDVPVLSLKIRRRGETVPVGEFYFVNNRWLQMPPLNLIFPDLR